MEATLSCVGQTTTLLDIVPESMPRISKVSFRGVHVMNQEPKT